MFNLWIAHGGWYTNWFAEPIFHRTRKHDLTESKGNYILWRVQLELEDNIRYEA